jgi:hypothetical protein
LSILSSQVVAVVALTLQMGQEAPVGVEADTEQRRGMLSLPGLLSQSQSVVEAQGLVAVREVRVVPPLYLAQSHQLAEAAEAAETHQWGWVEDQVVEDVMDQAVVPGQQDKDMQAAQAQQEGMVQVAEAVVQLVLARQSTAERVLQAQSLVHL